MLDTCPYCYTRVTKKDVFCPNCGKKLKQPKPGKSVTGPSAEPTYRPPPPREPTYAPSREPSYAAPDRGGPEGEYVRSKYQPVRRDVRIPPEAIVPAPCTDRCFAYCIDYFITGILSSMSCGILGCLYSYLKDGYDGGRSPGKQVMNMRVINYNTGMPITYGESCIRNFCNCCPPTILCNSEYRHIGDLIGGTMVIEDR
ncbi:MAG: RDD family protein [Candidatus Hodarchaeales archaeon]|jgi:uncharacterized RDD family membrane protein YckC